MTTRHFNTFAENEMYKGIIFNFEIVRGKVLFVALCLFMDVLLIVDWRQKFITSWIMFYITDFEVTDFVFINFKFQT